MRTAIVLAVLACVGPAFTHAGSPDVRDLMTDEEYEAAGLEKLDDAEIDALNRWLLRFSVREAPEVRRSKDETVQAEVAKAEEEGIRTRIVGEFRGWTGDTVFRLENGQVWRQRLPGRWFYRADSPEVVLKKNAVGYWVLRIVAADRGVGVTRLE
jgi:hypothetical protein